MYYGYSFPQRFCNTVFFPITVYTLEDGDAQLEPLSDGDTSRHWFRHQ